MSGKALVILWIEDQLLAIRDGVETLEDLVRKRMNRDPVIIGAGGDVETALAKLKQYSASPPDIIILDLMLPRNEKARKEGRVDMNAGFFLWHRLRHQEFGAEMAKVKVLVVTARGNPEFRAAMEEDEKLKWVGKPVGPSDLMEAIKELLESSA